MKQKTKKYEMFIFLDDNRDKIDQKHVDKISKSLQIRNLLEYKPISVTSKMEILDGQHRVLAAKQLGLEIYYEISESLTHKDIILMNMAKAWNNQDYMNYYVKNGFPEYIKLDEFIKKNRLTFLVALYLTFDSVVDVREEFRAGDFKFRDGDFEGKLEICHEIVDYITHINGYSFYSKSTRFWKALLVIVSHGEFDKDRFMINLERMITKVGPRVNKADYVKMFLEIHNWKRHNKIFIDD